MGLSLTPILPLSLAEPLPKKLAFTAPGRKMTEFSGVEGLSERELRKLAMLAVREADRNSSSRCARKETEGVTILAKQLHSALTESAARRAVAEARGRAATRQLKKSPASKGRRSRQNSSLGNSPQSSSRRFSLSNSPQSSSRLFSLSNNRQSSSRRFSLRNNRSNPSGSLRHRLSSRTQHSPSSSRRCSKTVCSVHDRIHYSKFMTCAQC